MYEVNKGYIFSEFQWLTATLIYTSFFSHNMVSTICQRLLNKVWRGYDVDNVPHVQGIYVIGVTVPRDDPEVLYVGRTNDVHRRLLEHRRQDLAIDEYVQQQFQFNNGEDLRIKWVHEENDNHVEREYRECIADKVGYWPRYNIQD